MHRETRRRMFHISFGTVLALLFYYGISKLIFAILLGGSIILFLLYKKFKIPILHDVMLALERPKNLRTFPGIGAALFMLGCTLAVYLYSKQIAIASIMILAWGDAISGLLGPYGKIRYINPKKTWEGIILGILAGTISAQFFVPFLWAFAASSVAMLIEGLDLKIGKWKINDNLLIPLIAGLVLTFS